MMIFEDTDFRPLDELPLKWRWTATRWNVLADEALQTIKPLTETKASQLWRYSVPFFDSSGLDRTLFENIKEIDSSGDRLRIQHWLLGCAHDLNQTVVVSWDERLAVLARWKVFCEFWDDFFYPASDDVTIFPQSEEWLLLYHHDESFVFGKRCADANQSAALKVERCSVNDPF